MCLICGLKIVENTRQINDAINVSVTGPALEKSIHVCFVFFVFFPNVCCLFLVHPGDGSRTIKHRLIVCRTTVLSCFRETEAKKIIRPGSTGSAVKRARQHRSPPGTKSMFCRHCLKEVALHVFFAYLFPSSNWVSMTRDPSIIIPTEKAELGDTVFKIISQ